ncbi:MAG: endonuclease MutS2 [Chloroflexi bacterium]|nr:endonuclease MutS2 [Chloroflexota bacterium]
MDSKSLDTLEFSKVLALLAARTSFTASRERALALTPTSDLILAERWQQVTAEALQLLGSRPDFSIRSTQDVRQLADKAARGGLLDPLQLVATAWTLESGQYVSGVLTKLNSEDYPELSQLGEQIAPLRELSAAIRRALSDDGDVLDDASPALARIRSEMRSAQRRIHERLQSYLTSHRSALQDPIITTRENRYVLPVKADARAQLPGLVHDQSASGATLFIEPLPVVELNNGLRTLQIRERQEIERILLELSARIGSVSVQVIQNIGALAGIDLALAKARLASEQDAVRPELTAEPIVDLIEARHPLLQGRVVPLSLRLGPGCRQIVITGPNTGGKTVALKAVGLLTLMALSGLHIPAQSGSVVGGIRQVWADIGDEQSIEQSLSTFSSHMTTIVRILRSVGPGDIVLLDELGAGTDPVEGSALARAILGYLLRRQALTLATTHYAELKAHAHTTVGVRNASMEFDVETLSPTYHLIMGLPGRSNALAIATRLGLPAEVVSEATNLLTPEQVEIEALLGQIATERREAERARTEAQRLERQAAAAQQAAERERAQWEREREQRLAAAERDAERQLEVFRRELGELRNRALNLASRREVQQLQEESAAVLRQLLEQRQHTRAKRVASVPLNELSPGDWVEVAALDQTGQLLTIDRERNAAEVIVGGLKLRVRPADLSKGKRPAERQSRSPYAHAPLERQVTVSKAPNVGMELDLRGRRVSEVESELDQFLNDAVRAGLPSARVVHGRGSGAVRQVVHEQLTGHPLVRSFRLGGTGEGGDGVTVVTL